MKFFDTLQAHITALDEKSWYKYLAIVGALFIILLATILFFYYRSVSHWEQKIATVNEERIEAKRLLDKAQRVRKERSEVAALLEEEPNFKIKQYMQDVFDKLGIRANVSVERGAVVTSRDDNYSETEVPYTISGITMKHLTELLKELDENKRIFIKDLDISKSKKVPRTIDVDIKVATLTPKEAL